MPTHHSRIVSVVDDDASIRRSLRNLLSSVGFQVETFESAEAFLAAGDPSTTDALVVDMRMPGMSGLDLLTHLAASGSRRRVIILTARADAETRQRSLQMGAVAFLEKPFECAALLDALQPCEYGGDQPVDGTFLGMSPAASRNCPLHFAHGTLDKHRHICAFFNNADEEHRVLRSFVNDGLIAGDKAVHIVDPALRADHLRRLASGGIDIEGAMVTGQLEVMSWHEAYLRGDCFDQDEMLAVIEGALRSNAASGGPLTRVVAHMEWALLDKPGVEELLEYETRANYILPKYNDAIICAYDVSKFSADLAMDIMRTHPMVIIGGVLRENPFFVPPDQLLLELQERGLARKTAGMVS